MFDCGLSVRPWLNRFLFLWLKSLWSETPDPLDFTRTASHVCRTGHLTALVQMGNYGPLRAMQTVFIYSFQTGNVAYSGLAISDG